MSRFHIPFMKNRWWMLGFSAVMITICLISLFTKGLNFGIDFKGGTVVEVAAPGGGKASADTIRVALVKSGYSDAVVQAERNVNQNQINGYLIRVGSSETATVTKDAKAALAANGLPSTEINVSSIGPGWGAQVTQAALLALAASLIAILLYVSIRFNYKMAVTAIVALIHDVIITLGIYSLTGFEMTPNTVAALLTILGFSLYDTIVVFHRIQENSQHLVKQSFMQMANESINQVLVRELNTSFVSIVPPLMLLFFGGPTLKDFAFALTVGLISGAYSSIAVASPLYAMWKEREPKFLALKKRWDKDEAAAAQS
jgi:SecD/SecF fusion protein